MDNSRLMPNHLIFNRELHVFLRVNTNRVFEGSKKTLIMSIYEGEKRKLSILF